MHYAFFSKYKVYKIPLLLFVIMTYMAETKMWFNLFRFTTMKDVSLLTFVTMKYMIWIRRRFFTWRYLSFFWRRKYILIYLLTAIGLSPDGSSTVHIYTQTIHRTIPNKQHIEQHNNMGKCGPCPVLASYTLPFALQLRKKHGKNSVRVYDILWWYS